MPSLEIAGQDSSRLSYQFTTNWLTDSSKKIWCHHLAEYIGRKDVRYLEIGSFEGRSLIWVLDHILTHPTARAEAVDVFQGQHVERFHSNILRSGHAKKVKLHQGFSIQMLPKLEDQSFDFVYVDGSHHLRDVENDILNSWRLLKTGGMLILDDVRMYKDHWPVDLRPAASVDLFLTAHRHELIIRHYGFQVIVQKRDNPHRFEQASSFFGDYRYDWYLRRLCSGTCNEILLTDSERTQLEVLLRQLEIGWVELNINDPIFFAAESEQLMSKLKIKRTDFLIGAWPDFPAKEKL